MVNINNAVNNTVGAANKGVTNTLTIQNQDNTSTNSQATTLLTVGGATAGTSAGNVWTQYTIGTTQSYSVGINNAASQTLQINSNAGATVSPASGTTIWETTAGGIITTPKNPAFFAYLNASQNNQFGINTVYYIPFTNTLVDQGGNFNIVGTGSGQGSFFLTPVAGVYQFNTTVLLNGLTNQTTVQIGFTTGTSGAFTNAIYPLSNTPVSFGSVSQLGFSGSIILNLAANVSVGVWASALGTTKVVGVTGSTVVSGQLETYFSGCKVA